VYRRQQACVDASREDMFVPQGGCSRIKAGDVRQPAAQHDDMRIEDVDDSGQRLCQPPGVSLKRIRAGRIAGFRPAGDVTG